MSQNKELKAQMVELQDAFVRLSQQNMELASDLETERLRVAHLKTHPLAEPKGKPLITEGEERSDEVCRFEATVFDYSKCTFIVVGFVIGENWPAKSACPVTD